MSKIVAVISKHSGSITTKLKQLLPSAHFIEVQPSDSALLKKADIIVGDYNLVGPYIYELPKLKWFHGTWAGLDALWPHIKNDMLPPVPITRTSGANFGQLMGEYVIGNIIFLERNYFKVIENQKNKVWNALACPHDHRSIKELTIGILGIGSIGNKVGKTLHYLGAKIYGFGRRESIPLETEEYKHISKYYTKTNLPELLKNVDYLVNILPDTIETRNILGNGILENCKAKNTVLINIGRGSVIKETELIQALQNKLISAAILDVFETEPLAQESALWTFSNVFITPHIAGNSRAQDIADIFKVNFELFERGQPLLNQVDFTKGY